MRDGIEGRGHNEKRQWKTREMVQRSSGERGSKEGTTRKDSGNREMDLQRFADFEYIKLI